MNEKAVIRVPVAQTRKPRSKVSMLKGLDSISTLAWDGSSGLPGESQGLAEPSYNFLINRILLAPEIKSMCNHLPLGLTQSYATLANWVMWETGMFP